MLRSSWAENNPALDAELEAQGRCSRMYGKVRRARVWERGSNAHWIFRLLNPGTRFAA